LLNNLVSLLYFERKRSRNENRERIDLDEKKDLFEATCCRILWSFHSIEFNLLLSLRFWDAQDVIEGLLDSSWDWWWGWEMVSLWLESTDIISDVGDLDELAFG
jgi:hypothetical protein